MTQRLFHGVVGPLEQLTSCSWRRLLPTVGSLIRLQDAEIVSLVAAKVADCEAWETVTEEEVAEADEEAKIKAAQACRGDTEVIWAQAPQTTALKRRFSLLCTVPVSE